MWATIHYVCMGDNGNIDSAKQHALRQWIQALPAVIPCYKCSLHLKENLENYPVDQHLGNHAELFKWSVDLHNLVNRQLGKHNVSYEDALKMYTSSAPVFGEYKGGVSQPEKPSKSSYNMLSITLGFIFGIALMFVIFIFRKGGRG